MNKTKICPGCNGKKSVKVMTIIPIVVECFICNGTGVVKIPRQKKKSK